MSSTRSRGRPPKPNVVPPERYKTLDDGITTVVTWVDLQTYHTRSDYAKLRKWMFGQTCHVEGVYTWDYERWLREGKSTDQHASTWD